jgi:hypothetical protein
VSYAVAIYELNCIVLIQLYSESMSQMAPYSLYSALLLNRTL